MPRHRLTRVLCPEVLRDHHKFHLPGEKRHPNFITFLNRKLQTNPDFCLNHKNGSTIPIFFSNLSCSYKSENLECSTRVKFSMRSFQFSELRRNWPKNLAIFSVNENQLCLVQARLRALRTSCMNLLWLTIGSFDCRRRLRLVVIFGHQI